MKQCTSTSPKPRRRKPVSRALDSVRALNCYFVSHKIYLSPMKKNCPRCGAGVPRKTSKFCGRKCMSDSYRGMRHGTSDASARKLARAKKAHVTCCESCGRSKFLVVHHADGNPHNNTPNNLTTLCRKCHASIHGFIGKAPCAVCGKPQMAKGYCNKHYLRWRKWGDPRTVKINQYAGMGKKD